MQGTRMGRVTLSYLLAARNLQVSQGHRFDADPLLSVAGAPHKPQWRLSAQEGRACAMAREDRNRIW